MLQREHGVEWSCSSLRNVVGSLRAGMAPHREAAQVERDAAEERAATIVETETRALCGEREGCEVPRVVYKAELVLSCGGEILSGFAEFICNQAMDSIDSVLVEVPLAAEVVDLPPSVAPAFQDLGGHGSRNRRARHNLARRPVTHT